MKRSSVDVIDLRSVTEIKEIDHYSYMFSGFKEIHLETMKEFYHYYFDIKADEKIYLNKFCIVDNYERLIIGDYLKLFSGTSQAVQW